MIFRKRGGRGGPRVILWIVTLLGGQDCRNPCGSRASSGLRTPPHCDCHPPWSQSRIEMFNLTKITTTRTKTNITRTKTKTSRIGTSRIKTIRTKFQSLFPRQGKRSNWNHQDQEHQDQDHCSQLPGLRPTGPRLPRPIALLTTTKTKNIFFTPPRTRSGQERTCRSGKEGESRRSIFPKHSHHHDNKLS